MYDISIHLSYMKRKTKKDMPFERKTFFNVRNICAFQIGITVSILDNRIFDVIVELVLQES